MACIRKLTFKKYKVIKEITYIELTNYCDIENIKNTYHYQQKQIYKKPDIL